MKIKHLVAAVLMLVVQQFAFAQKGEVSSAKSNYDKYTKFKESGAAKLGEVALKSAKKSIDNAVKDEKTKNNSETWVYKALIDADLALIDSTNSSEELFSSAKNAYQTANQLDKVGLNKLSLEYANGLFAQYELKKGVSAYQLGNYKEASSAFEKSLMYLPGDTTLTNYSGLAAINDQNYPLAIQRYSQLVGANVISYSIDCAKCDVTYTNKDGGVEQQSNVNSNWNYAFDLKGEGPVSIIATNKNNSGKVKSLIYLNGNLLKSAESNGAFVSAGSDALVTQILKGTDYSQNAIISLDLSKLYAIQKDTASAIVIASKYGSKYNDADLTKQEIELSLMSGKEKETLAKITAQAAKEPTNKLYPFYLGIAYSAIKDTPRAEEAYKKAIELDPKYEDALINLGSTILNAGIDLYNKANRLPMNKQKEYDALMKQANAEFDRAFQYLQKATDNDPKSINAWENLKTYYVIRRNQAKVDEISKILAGL